MLWTHVFVLGHPMQWTDIVVLGNPTQWTHGIVFGLMWAAGTTYCRSIAPEGMGATMQGFFTAWMWGIGTGSGCLVGGAITAKYDVRAVFAVRL